MFPEVFGEREDKGFCSQEKLLWRIGVVDAAEVVILHDEFMLKNCSQTFPVTGTDLNFLPVIIHSTHQKVDKDIVLFFLGGIPF